MSIPYTTFAEISNVNFQNEAILTVDYDSNTYLLDNNGVETRGSWSGSANLSEGSYATIATFSSVDTGKLTVSSDSGNQGDVDLKVTESGSGKAHYSTTSLSPGHSWTTSGGLNGWWTDYTLTGSPTKSGKYKFTLKW